MKKLPLVSRELVDALAERFPDKCPEVNTPIDEVRARAGEQRVLRLLWQTYQEQNENVLAREVLD